MISCVDDGWMDGCGQEWVQDPTLTTANEG